MVFLFNLYLFVLKGCAAVMVFYLLFVLTLTFIAKAGPDTTVVCLQADTADIGSGFSDSLKTVKEAGTSAQAGSGRNFQGSTGSAAKKDSSSDSARILFRRDSLLALERGRRLLFYPDTGESDPSLSDQTSVLFRSDATSWYDVPSVKRHAAGPRTGISNCFNRLLLYGNVAPLTKIYKYGGLIYHTAANPLYADDALFPFEYGGVFFPGDGSVRFRPSDYKPVSPESVIFWENGVFDENILSIRFSRALARRLSLNVFSNYRYFKGMSFSHDGNDVYTLYANITHDTTLISHKGYNPLVNEYFCGADALWSGGRTNAFLRVKYGDVVDELPLDRKPEGADMELVRVQQYPLSIESFLAADNNSRWFLRCEAHALYNPYTLTRSKSFRQADKAKIASNDISGAVRAGVNITEKDTLSFTSTLRRLKIEEGDTAGIVSMEYRPELMWSRRLLFASVNGTAAVSAGWDIYSEHDDAFYSPFFSASMQMLLSGYCLKIYGEKDNLHCPPFLDSVAAASTLHETYYRTGIELERGMRLFSLLLGYQRCSDIDTSAVKRAWFSNTPPYRQPRSVLIVSPRLGRWRGLLLSSRLMLSESKPFVKLRSGLSWLLIPKPGSQSIDIRIETEYWSERDSILFAGKSDWHRYILDVNFATTVHIKSFRLIYKIDNLLNRKFSYVPGCYSPGITFRWGFSWFIQR